MTREVKRRRTTGRTSNRTKRLTRRMIKRLLVVVMFMLVFFSVVVINIIKLQVGDNSTYQKKVLNQQLGQQKYSSTTLYYKRGDVLDRKGSFLATSTKVYNLILEPKNIIKSEDYKDSKTKMTYKDITVNALYRFFDFKQGEIEEILEENKESYYYIAFTKLNYDDVSEYMDYCKEEGDKIIGVKLEENYSRTYPNMSAACQLIGYTSSGNVGNWGIEQQYNDILNGINGRTYSYMNSEGDVETNTKNPTDGNSVVSTIDLNIQNITDKQLNNFMNKIGASNASILVMDPNNGEVLAMSNSKTYDLNNPYDESVLGQVYTADEIAAMTEEDKVNALSEFWRNYIISDTYEPGSTFKPFTVCAALEEGLIKDGDSYYCGGSMKVTDHIIRCHNTAGDGWIDIEHSIAESCNVALMQIGDIMGKERFLKYQSAFGFGQYTNIDLPGESAAESLIFNQDTLGVTELATSTFGQGQNCTMIQLATGFCSLINGGNYYEPHVVKEIRGADGETVKTIEKKLVKKTISKSTSKLIKRYLKTTVEEGTGSACQIAGYDIGGKTGTAEKMPRNNNKYLISFIGYAPYENPEVVVYVTIDEINLTPQDQTSYAVKLARQVFKHVLPYLGVEQNAVNEEEATQKIESVNENGTVSVGIDDEDPFAPTTEEGSTEEETATEEESTSEEAATTSEAEANEEGTTQSATTEPVQN